MTAFLVVVGAAVGAPVRFLVDRWAKAHLTYGVIAGTLIVNVVGSLLLGAVAAASAHPQAPTWLLPLLGTGLCGALTTFSTLAYETVLMTRDGRLGEAMVNLVANLGLGGLAVTLGWALLT